MRHKFFGFLKGHPVISPDQVMEALATVLEPEVNRDLVSLGLVKNVSARDGKIAFTILLREAGSPLQVPLERRARRAVMAIPGVKEIDIRFESSPTSHLRETSRINLDVKKVIAVASGKGGVGKSTVAVNLAVTLAQMGQRVALLDGDIHGPNIPQMMGIGDDKPFSFGDQIFPPTAHRVIVMSMGFLVPAEAPVIWRGPMLHQALRQLLRDVMWGQLDCLIVDLPPGTGDVQLTLTQSLPLAGALIVTTPQDVAMADALKGGEMFRQLEIPVLGIVENMSYYLCPHCGKAEPIFGEGAGDELAKRLQTQLLARLPLESAIRRSGDSGIPIVLSHPTSPIAQAFKQIATNIKSFPL